jgi:hypothetical protein
MAMPPGKTRDYALFGWRIHSDLALPELLTWSGDDRAPDIEIISGAVPGALPQARQMGPAAQIAADGRVRFSVAGVAAYLIEGDSRVTIDAVLPADAPDIRVFLFGTVLGILCHRRGLLPLHAAAVEIGGRAILLAGPSGVGKSTLAAALASRGHRLLADDLCAIRREQDGSVSVLASFPRVRLWRDALDALGLPSAGLERSRPGMEKYHVPIDAGGSMAVPPGAVVCLGRFASPTAIKTEVVRGYATIETQAALVYRYRLALSLGAHASVLGIYTKLVERRGLIHLCHHASFTDLPALCEAAEALAA